MDLETYIAELTKLRQAHGGKVQVVQRTIVNGVLTKKGAIPRIASLRNDNKRVLFGKDDLDKFKGEKVVVL